MSETIAQNSDNNGIEERFLAGLSAPKPPVKQMLGDLRRIYDGGERDTADGWAEMLLDACKTRNMIEDGLDVLETRCKWKAADPSFRGTCLKWAAAILEQHPNGAAFVDCSGFGNMSVRTTDCMSRLRLLLNLKPGVACVEKTWGFGIVARMDGFYRKVSVDFENKKGHELSFEYAAQALKLIGPDHILAIRHSDPDRLAALVKDDPAEVVRMALRSGGPMSAVILQEFLSDRVLPADKWKTFWDSARKGLKCDPLVDFPAKRTDPIALREKRKAFDEEWFGNFAIERNMDRLLEMMEELAIAGGDIMSSADRRAALKDRMAFIMKGAAGSRPDLEARALMIAGPLQLQDSPGMSAAEELILSAKGLAAIADSLPSSRIRRFLEYMAVRLGDGRSAETLLTMLPDMPLAFLSEILSHLSSRGFEERVKDTFRKAITERTASLGMLYWLCRKPQEATDHIAYGAPAEVLRQVFEHMRGSLHGEKLRIARLFRELFERPEWISGTMGQMTGEQRAEFVVHVRDCVAWPQIDRNSVLVRIIRRYPELERLMVAGSPAQAEPAKPRGRFTSWRSYNERKTRLEKIVNVELPQNARDLAHAREYGDLSENHEFKAAKERQAILVNQRDSLADELSIVKGTDFGEFPTDAAGPGTRVELEAPDGKKTDYFILGEWDGDPAQRILSSRSALAVALIGRKAGENVSMPDSADNAACRISAVGPLPESIVTWIKAANEE